MSGTTLDPAAMDAKLDRILGQLTTINNRLNSHDSRLARVETSKTNDDKGAGGNDDHSGDDEVEDNAHDIERNRAWASFRDRALRDRDRFAGGAFDRDFSSRGYDDRGGRGHDDRGG